MQLSPLNYFGIVAQMQNGLPDSGPTEGRRPVEQVMMFRCPECGELHEDEDEAEECCYGKDWSAAPDSEAFFPVCGQEYATHRDASDCCLWKDINALTRWSIADAVEFGSDWVTELGLKGVTASPLSLCGVDHEKS
jgi:hypothetical protein